ncbi:EamA-like transporter family protein [Roseivivax jejudonensis]|uniref:EamA-like transporter family protein n=1 Tax=Roseivivax jejudonensis TaxID=1529041 RepID=A0A1X7A5N7_9RHOB|nr:DMT family transporter [Roseivivax jejudonensis]SLN71328.1 EamA-like transporter family protein [Roseivivax jejudonensis]
MANLFASSIGETLKPLASLAGAGACLGLSTTMAKIADSAGITGLPFLAWSVLGAALILFLVSYLRGDLPPVTRRTAEYFCVSAFVTVAASNLIFFLAVPRVGVSFVSLAITLPPLLTYLGALILGMEKFMLMRAAGVCAALIGAAVLAVEKLGAPDADIFWICLALTGPLLLAIGNLYRTARWPKGVTAEALAPGMLGVAAAMLFAFALVPDFDVRVPLDTAGPALLIAGQSLVFSAQFLLLFVLQKSGGPVLLSLLGAVGAVVAVPFAVFFLGETPPQGLAVGAGLIALGIALVATGKAKADRREVRSRAELSTS